MYIKKGTVVKMEAYDCAFHCLEYAILLLFFTPNLPTLYSNKSSELFYYLFLYVGIGFNL